MKQESVNSQIHQIMKTRMKFLMGLLSVGLCIQSCSKDNFEEVIISRNEIDEPVTEAIAQGTLSLEVFLKDPISITTARALTLEEALDVMLVEITSTDGLTTFVSENYRDLPANIELPPGSYNMLISNFRLIQVRFDDGAYGDYIQNFEVTSGNNTVLSPVLELLDVATTVNFSNDIIAAYPDISVRLSRYNVDPFSYEFGEFPLSLNHEVADDGRRSYHSLFTGNHVDGYTVHTSSMQVRITATDSFGEVITVTRDIYGMANNEHYNFNIEMTGPSSTTLDVSLEPEVDNTEVITFPN